jgi:hypothetical protein
MNHFLYGHFMPIFLAGYLKKKQEFLEFQNSRKY